MKRLLVIAIVMLILDAIYLNTFSQFFNNVVMRIQGSKIKFNLIGAVLCYIILIGGLDYFIISKKKSLMDAFLLGIVIYGVYETTTYAIFDKWSPMAVIIDTLWGGILFTLTTFITYRLV